MTQILWFCLGFVVCLIWTVLRLATKFNQQTVGTLNVIDSENNHKELYLQLNNNESLEVIEKSKFVYVNVRHLSQK